MQTVNLSELVVGEKYCFKYLPTFTGNYRTGILKGITSQGILTFCTAHQGVKYSHCGSFSEFEVLNLKPKCKWEVGDKALCGAGNVEVTAIGQELAIVKDAYGLEQSCGITSLHPIKTPAEIERERVVDKLTERIINFHGNPKGAESYKLLAEHLINAGWTDKKVKPLSLDDLCEVIDANTTCSRHSYSGVEILKSLSEEGYIIEAKPND